MAIKIEISNSFVKELETCDLTSAIQHSCDHCGVHLIESFTIQMTHFGRYIIYISVRNYITLRNS